MSFFTYCVCLVCWRGNAKLEYRPLLPSACHTAELRFIALATGVLNVEGVRVLDLVTNETTDCRELPSIVSVGERYSEQGK